MTLSMPDDRQATVGGLPSWAPDGIDVERPSASRVYDYFLGGSHNFAADRQFAKRIVADQPGVPGWARANRAFLGRAVRFLLDAGIRQFVDLGSGIPTVGNVHEVARRVAPEARVVYVDRDPVAAAHSRELLAGDEHTGVVQADIRHPDQVLGDPVTRKLIDFDEPVGVLIVAVLHFVANRDDPAGIVAGFRDAVVPESFAVVSHATWLPGDTAAADRAVDAYRATDTPVTLRSRERIAGLLDGWQLVAPGVAGVDLWRPDDGAEPDERVPGFAAVGRKRAGHVR